MQREALILFAENLDFDFFCLRKKVLPMIKITVGFIECAYKDLDTDEN